ncbi:MAG: sensor histidine kinase [Chthoniobacterales bacterium]
MFVLGLIFKTGRKRAFAKMQVALDQLATSNAELVVLNREKTEFLGIAAHDLRNPLNTIVGYAQLLQANGNDAKNVPKFANAINTAGTRMRDLIKNLLDANAVEQGRFSCEVQRCDLRELIAESLEHNRIDSERKEIAITVEMADGAAAGADRITTVQVLDNLISNAIKYSPFETTIRVRGTVEDGSVFITVTDEGPGVSEEDQKRMFGKFARLSARPTGGESSTGLGLSIVKKLVRAMSGSIECRSTFGHGSSFILRLPAWEPSPTTR